VRHLAHRTHRFADRAGDLIVIETEHLAKDEDRPLVGVRVSSRMSIAIETDSARTTSVDASPSASSRGSGSHGPM
jgi:hypothetical protein